MKKTLHVRFVHEMGEMLKDFKTLNEDLGAFMRGEIGPTQKAYIEKINSNWNGYNFIVQFGHVFRLTDKVRYKDNGAMYTPCENCELSGYCSKDIGRLCDLLQAGGNEWFEDAGELILDKKGKMKVEPW